MGRKRCADVAHPAVGFEDLAEVLGHLPVPAAARLGEVHKSFSACERLSLVASEECVDSCRRIGGRVRNLDLHRPAGVEAAAHQADLFEHPHEHAWVRLVAELLGRYLRAAAQA